MSPRRSWRRWIACGVLGGCIAPGVATRAPAQSCCPPVIVQDQRVVTPGWGGVVRWMLADAIGGVYTGWQGPQIGDDECNYWVSRDDGETWQLIGPHAPIRGAWSQPAVAPDGHFLVASSDAGAIVVNASADQARSFTTTTMPTRDARPTIEDVAMDVTGLSAACWNEQGDLWCAASSDFGVTWSQPALVGAGAWSTYPLVQCLPGTCLVAFDVQDEAQWSWTGDIGRTWSVAAPIDPDTHPNFLLGLTTTTGSNVQVLTWVYSSDVLQVRVSSDAGRSWSRSHETIPTPTRLHGANGASFVGALDGSVHVAWDDDYGQPDHRARYARSTDHGRPRSWTPAPGEPARLAVAGVYPTLTSIPFGPITHVLGDSRDLDSAVYFDSSCDQGTTWLPDGLRLGLYDTTPGYRVPYPKTAVSGSGRLHVAWREQAGPIHHVALDAHAGAPRITPVTTPRCGLTTGRFAVVADSISWCTTPRVQWLIDGQPQAGATAMTFDVPAGLAPGVHWCQVAIDCAEDAPCETESVGHAVVVRDEPPLRPEVEPLLFVTRTESLDLRWNYDAMEASAFSIYAGSIASLRWGRTYDHAGVACHVLRTPAGATSTSASVPMPAVNSYYLVTPANCVGEGSTGSNSFGVARPIAGQGAACGPTP